MRGKETGAQIFGVKAPEKGFQLGLLAMCCQDLCDELVREEPPVGGKAPQVVPSLDDLCLLL